jgi:hypothetical protein
MLTLSDALYARAQHACAMCALFSTGAAQILRKGLLISMRVVLNTALPFTCIALMPIARYLDCLANFSLDTTDMFSAVVLHAACHLKLDD